MRKWIEKKMRRTRKRKWRKRLRLECNVLKEKAWQDWNEEVRVRKEESLWDISKSKQSKEEGKRKRV